MTHPTAAITLLVAHGSRNVGAVRAHEDLCAAVAEQVAADGRRQSVAGQRADEGQGTDDDRGGDVDDRVGVRAAYLEINEPSIGEAIDRAAADGATAVRVVPHFLAPGNHVAVDIPAIVDAARARHPGVSIELTEHSGADPAMVGLLAARVLR